MRAALLNYLFLTGNEQFWRFHCVWWLRQLIRRCGSGESSKGKVCCERLLISKMLHEAHLFLRLAYFLVAIQCSVMDSCPNSPATRCNIMLRDTYMNRNGNAAGSILHIFVVCLRN